MIKFIFHIAIAIVLVGCQDVKRPDMPENLIPQDIMVQILTDTYLSNASRSINNKLIKKAGLKLDSMLYIKYNIDSIQFVESNAFYASDLELYDNLLSRVEERLTRIQEGTDSITDPLKINLYERAIDSGKVNKEGLIESVDSESN